MGFRNTPLEDDPTNEPSEIHPGLKRRTVGIEVKGRRTRKSGAGVLGGQPPTASIEVVQRDRGAKSSTKAADATSPPRIALPPVVLPPRKRQHVKM